MMDSGVCGEAAQPTDRWPWLGQANDLISEHMSPSDLLPHRRHGTYCVGKVSRKTASRGTHVCTRRDGSVETTRAGDSLRRDDPRARARQPHLGKKPSTPSDGGDDSGDDGRLFFSLKIPRDPQGFLEKTGSGTDNSIAPQGQGWLAGEWLRADPERCNCPTERPSHDEQTPSGPREQTSLALGRQTGGIPMSAFLGDPKGPRRRSSDRRHWQGGMCSLLSAMWTGLGTCLPVSVVLVELFVSATKTPPG